MTSLKHFATTGTPSSSESGSLSAVFSATSVTASPLLRIHQSRLIQNGPDGSAAEEPFADLLVVQ